MLNLGQIPQYLGFGPNLRSFLLDVELSYPMYEVLNTSIFLWQNLPVDSEVH